MSAKRVIRNASILLIAALAGVFGCAQSPTTPSTYTAQQPAFVKAAAPQRAQSTALTGGGGISLIFKFNGTSVPAGNTIWFSSVIKYSGVNTLTPTTILVDPSTIQFPVKGGSLTVSVPAGRVVLSPTAVLATTSYDATSNTWTTVTPYGTAGAVFLTGVPLPLSAPLPGGVDSIAWNANFTTSTSGVSVSWQWAAAAYSSFGTDLTQLGVKPVDDGHVSTWLNSDHAGTPENFKGKVIGGATGGGGSNYTGGLSSTLTTVPALGTGPLSGTAQIDGGKGGDFTVGRFKVHVPAGAYAGPATIGISVPDQGVLQCDLYITPQVANQFAVPVILSSNYSGANVPDPTTLLEVWFDTSTQLWRAVPGSSVDTTNQLVVAPLTHFSSYGVVNGKAGW